MKSPILHALALASLAAGGLVFMLLNESEGLKAVGFLAVIAPAIIALVAFALRRASV